MRFIQHKLVINACVSDRVFLQTTLLVSSVVRGKKIKNLSSDWWRFELATSAIGWIGNINGKADYNDHTAVISHLKGKRRRGN